MPNHMTATQSDGSEDTDTASLWDYLPDNLLLMVFSCLKHQPLTRAAQVCRQWYRVALDELLWKDLFYSTYAIPRTIPRAPGKTSWLSEFRRLYAHIPVVESETIADHRDQVLHVTFSHDGKMFSSCSKDGYVKVWNATSPVSLKYYADMKELNWKYTQFSQFNESDSLLLVSGVHFGSQSTSGEIAVFNISGDKFELQCRVLNKPYDVFGTWYNNDYLLSGNIHWLGNYTSCSVLWLNKASQALESQHESVVLCLYKFLNINASSVRTIMVAECVDTDSTIPHECRQTVTKHEKQDTEKTKQEPTAKTRMGSIEYENSYRQVQMSEVVSEEKQLDLCETSSSNSVEEFTDKVGDVYEQWYSSGYTAPEMDSEVHHSESSSSLVSGSDSSSNWYTDTSSDANPVASTSASIVCPKCNSTLASKPKSQALPNKYLIFTMGTKTYTPHQIGIKLLSAEEASDSIEAMVMRKQRERTVRTVNHRRRLIEAGADFLVGEGLIDPVEPGVGLVGEEVEPNIEVQDDEDDKDTVDHLIELHGHIIGMCLSPDQRFLYVNSRPWPKNYIISDPLRPPPIAQEIDIHVIDLVTMEEVGTMHRAHKAYTPNDECFFIFLDVCAEYVASGAENHHGYLWDRHYGVCLAQYPHQDVVNCVAFNPRDQETLITASDDNTLKVWRSRNRQKQLADRGSGVC